MVSSPGGQGLGLFLVLLMLQGCGLLSSKVRLDSGRVSGRLLEHRDSGGHVRRLSIQGLEGWQWWDRNAIKGDEAGIIALAEITF